MPSRSRLLRSKCPDTRRRGHIPVRIPCMLRHAHPRCVPSPKNGEKPRPCTRHRTLAPHFRRFLCPDREDSPRSRPTITPYSESKTRFKTHDGPRPPQTPPASSKRPNQKWPGITAEPFSHYLCRATSDWLLTFVGTNPPDELI